MLCKTDFHRKSDCIKYHTILQVFLQNLIQEFNLKEIYLFFIILLFYFILLIREDT